MARQHISLLFSIVECHHENEGEVYSVARYVNGNYVNAEVIQLPSRKITRHLGRHASQVTDLSRRGAGFTASQLAYHLYLTCTYQIEANYRQAEIGCRAHLV